MGFLVVAWWLWPTRGRGAGSTVVEHFVGGLGPEERSSSCLDTSSFMVVDHCSGKVFQRLPGLSRHLPVGSCSTLGGVEVVCCVAPLLVQD